MQPSERKHSENQHDEANPKDVAKWILSWNVGKKNFLKIADSNLKNMFLSDFTLEYIHVPNLDCVIVKFNPSSNDS